MDKQWEHLLSQPSILYIQSARNNPDCFLVASNQNDSFQLYHYNITNKKISQITNSPSGKVLGNISPDGRFVYLLNDTAGNEQGHFHRIEVSTMENVDLTPELPSYYSYTIDSSEDNKKLTFVAATENGNEVYFVNLSPTKHSTSVYKTNLVLSEPIISPDGTKICVVENNNRLILLDLSTYEIKETIMGNDFSQTFPLTFLDQEKESSILLISNHGGSYKPIIWGWAAGKTKDINLETSNDLFVLGKNKNSNSLILCETKGPKQQLITHNLETKVSKNIGPTQGSFDLFFGAATFDHHDNIIIKWQSFISPPQIYSFQSPTYQEKTLLSFGKNPPVIQTGKFKPQSITFPSSDDTNVQMWLTLANKKSSPAIIHIHGGPNSLEGDAYSPEALIWLENGFNYCSVNYRGSIGFGKEFEEKIYGNPGYWELEDIKAAREWLIKNNVSEPQNIFLQGESWGGYLTLLAMGKYPDLWAGGVAEIPIADYVEAYKEEPAYFQAFDKKIFGGTPEELPEKYKNSSPITYVENLKSPILIIYGENDARCPAKQVKKYITAAKKLGKEVETKTFLSGHTGFADNAIRVENFSATLNFLLRIKNGG